MNEFVIIGESLADTTLATELAGRIFIEKAEWLEPYLPHKFKWCGLKPDTDYSCWKDLKTIIAEAKANGARIPRYLGGKKPVKADGASAHKVLYLVNELRKERPIRTIILVRDIDHQYERKEGLEHARESYAHLQHQLQIVIGAANCMREAWVLNGFVPLDVEEQKRLEAYIAQLKFDPCLEAERLRSRSWEMPDRVRNPKVVVEVLTNKNQARERQCWQETDLNLLRDRGHNTGLTDYMQEVEQRLLSILVTE
ncbi:MAG: hypothetical protein IAE79_25575 [Anaerolinea sp.]|nr:hypothetical protein [Anaerolinea sp.]